MISDMTNRRIADTIEPCDIKHNCRRENLRQFFEITRYQFKG